MYAGLLPLRWLLFSAPAMNVATGRLNHVNRHTSRLALRDPYSRCARRGSSTRGLRTREPGQLQSRARRRFVRTRSLRAVRRCALQVVSCGEQPRSAPMHSPGPISRYSASALPKPERLRWAPFSRDLICSGGPTSGGTARPRMGEVNFAPIIAFARTAQLFQDIPFALPFTFQALDQPFPGSKFILSVRRDAEEWYGSLTRFATSWSARVGCRRVTISRHFPTTTRAGRSKPPSLSMMCLKATPSVKPR